MTFHDIFESNFLENIAMISILDMVIALALSFLLDCSCFLSIRKATAASCIPQASA